MMEKGFLVDAVAEFVKGSVWRDTVTHFLETHYKRFLTDSESESKVNGYTLEQYDSFMAFKDSVERMLEGVVSDLSCSGEDLVEAIKENLKYESALSTEKRFCIQTLLTFDDYDAFYSRIREYATEKQGDGNADGNAEISEWALQEAIARSILEAHTRGQLDEAEAIWLPWAQAFVQMSQATASSEELAVEESEDKAEAKDSSENDPEDKEDTRMHELEKILIRERFKVDLLVAQRIADANTQMKKQMLNLAAEVVNQDEQVDDVAISAEEELAGLFKHIETMSDRLKDVKIRCFKFESVTQQQWIQCKLLHLLFTTADSNNMLRSYLYLKEKVHYKQDLVSQEKEIAAFILMQIHEKDESLVPLILEWLLLESEQLRTQTQIQEHLAGPRDEGYWTQEWDESSQAFYYFNSESKESVWEPPAAGFYDINNEFHVPGLEIEIANDEAQETPYTEGVYNPESATDELPTLEQASSQLDATFELTIGPDATEMVQMESVLERISREHDQERKRLELVFELEKARQKEELRKRKEKKRREKLAKKQRQKDDASKGDGEASAQSPTSSHVAEIIDVKSEDTSHLNINVPGHGRIDLAHLLSDAHATRHRQLKGISPAHERVMLNPATLRYLTEQMAIKQPDVLGQQVRREIVLEEAADSK